MPSAQCDCRERAVHTLIVSTTEAQLKRESAENHQQDVRMNTVASSVARPWPLLGRHDRLFFTENISGDLMAHWKIKQLCANAVETRLGVTGLNSEGHFYSLPASSKLCCRLIIFANSWELWTQIRPDRIGSCN